MRVLVVAFAVLALAGAASACTAVSAAQGTTVRSIIVTATGCSATGVSVSFGLYHDVNLTSQDLPYSTATPLNGDNTTNDGTAVFTFSDLNAGCFYIRAVEGVKPWVTAPTATCTQCAAPTATTRPTLDTGTTESYIQGSNLHISITEPVRFWSVAYEFVGYKSSDCKIDANSVSSGDDGSTGSGLWTRTWKDATTTTCSAKARYHVSDFNNALKNCNWARNEDNPAQTVFSTFIRATTKLQGQVIRGVHYAIVEETVINFNVAFLTNVQANATTVVFAPVITFAQMYKSAFDPATAHLDLLLLTSVQAPYQLHMTSSQVSTVSTGSIFGAVAVAAGNASDTGTFSFSQSGYETFAVNDGDATNPRPACIDTSGSSYIASDFSLGGAAASHPCTQFWRLSATRGGSCASDANLNLSATWTQTFTVACDASFNGSCATPQNNSVTISFRTDSDNFCPRVFATDAASAILKVFDTTGKRGAWTSAAASADTQSQFVFGTSSHFRAMISSSSAPMYWARAEAIAIVSGYAAQTGTTGRQYLYNNPWTDANWWNNNLNFNIGTATQANGWSLVEPWHGTSSGSSAAAATVWVDFSFNWDSVVSAATGDFPTTTQVRFDGRARFISGAAKLSARLEATSHPSLLADETIGSAQTQFGVRASGTTTPAADGAGSAAMMSTGTVAIGAAVAGVALVAAGVAAGAIRSRRRDSQRKSNHLASVDLAIPNMPSSSSANLDV